MKKIVILFSIIAMIITNIAGCGNKRVDSQEEIKFQHESEHFKFYCENKDKKALSDLEKYLELAYPKITDNLKVKLDKKIDVRIYSDVEALKKATGNTNVPDWYMGEATSGDIKIVSPLNPPGETEYLEVIAVSIHEFTHLVSSKVLSYETKSVYWIAEGISCYEAKQVLGNNTRQKLYNEAINSHLPTINQLESANFQMVGQYDYAYSLVEYTINKYGYEKFNQFIRKNYSKKDFSDVFGVSKETFVIEWNDFIKQNYK